MADGKIYQMNNSMSYIPIISGDSELVKIVNNLSISSKFPYYINSTDDCEEILYLVPYVIYNVQEIKFCVSLISQLSNNKTYTI